MVWRSRVNPWCLMGIAWLAVVRGLVYIAGILWEGYKIPAALEIVLEVQWQLAIAGAVWVLVGGLFGLSVVMGWKLREHTALLVGVQAVWVVLHVGAMVIDPSFNTLLSLSIHLVLILCVLTFVQQELSKPREVCGSGADV